MTNLALLKLFKKVSLILKKDSLNFKEDSLNYKKDSKINKMVKSDYKIRSTK